VLYSVGWKSSCRWFDSASGHHWFKASQSRGFFVSSPSKSQFYIP